MPLTKPLPRQLLLEGIRRAVGEAFDGDDQQYGRQLASIFERQSMRLRLRFGGTPLWDGGPKR